MLNTNINILLSAGTIPQILLWGPAPPTTILVELLILLQVPSYMKVTIPPPMTMTSPSCRSVFPSVYQYTTKCVLVLLW